MTDDDIFNDIARRLPQSQDEIPQVSTSLLGKPCFNRDGALIQPFWSRYPSFAALNLEVIGADPRKGTYIIGRRTFRLKPACGALRAGLKPEGAEE